MFQLMDHYTAIVSIIFLAFFEVIAICVVFGEFPSQTKICPLKHCHIVTTWMLCVGVRAFQYKASTVFPSH